MHAREAPRPQPPPTPSGRAWMQVIAAAVVCAGACAAPERAGEAMAAAPLDRVIVISVDGLCPQAYTAPDQQGLAVPTLREMVRTGAHSPGVRSVFPAVTYPAHTTMVTGVDPDRHGIVTNGAWDPGELNLEGWRWYAEDIKVPTLWTVAAAAGLPTALVHWPVTVGAQAAVVVPEYWRAGTADDGKLLRALATPGVLAAAGARFPDLWRKLTPPNVADEATADLVVHVLETARPRLLLAHIWQTDDAAHKHGPGSPQARAAIENADAQLGRILRAARATGSWQRTAFVVVSDHGFTSADRQLVPGALLRDAGLLRIDEEGHPVEWKATVVTSGGMAFFYVADARDHATAQRLRVLLEDLAGRPGSGIGRLLEAHEVRARGGDRQVFLAAEAASGFAFGSGYRGPAYGKPKHVGQHGFDPARPEMNASLLVVGGAFAPQTIEGARLVDLAPTVAGWLGLRWATAGGRRLAIALR